MTDLVRLAHLPSLIFHLQIPKGERTKAIKKRKKTKAVAQLFVLVVFFLSRVFWCTWGGGSTQVAPSHWFCLCDDKWKRPHITFPVTSSLQRLSHSGVVTPSHLPIIVPNPNLVNYPYLPICIFNYNLVSCTGGAISTPIFTSITSFSVFDRVIEWFEEN